MSLRTQWLLAFALLCLFVAALIVGVDELARYSSGWEVH